MSAASLGPIAGFRVATAAIGDAYEGRPNLLLAAFPPGTQVAGVLTRSSTAAAPVRWTRARLAEGTAPRALVVNAGNANCFTGPAGEEAVRRTAEAAAAIVGSAAENVYLASTGRIGEPLDMSAYLAALQRAGDALSAERWNGVAEAIMTTDRFPKAAVRRVAIGGREATLQGITKGNTMIAPHMATTLSFLFTDAPFAGAALQGLLAGAAARTYNRISVDNTQSTNDTLLLFAAGGGDGPAPDAFAAALEDLLGELSGLIVSDAAGDGIRVSVRVVGAASEAAAARMARAVADSYLVRRDLADARALMPGRMVAALGMAEEAVDLTALTVRLGDRVLVEGGGVVGSAAVDVRALLAGGRAEIEIAVGVGEGCASVWAVA